MSFFPILRAPGCFGKTTLYNFSPNNWETSIANDMFVILTWLQNGLWHSATLASLDHGDSISFSSTDIIHYCDESLPLLSLSPVPLNGTANTLPVTSNRTSYPAWRSTLSLFSDTAVTSYQGELMPFPTTGTLLSLAPLTQQGPNVENYLLFLNLENVTSTRTAYIDIYDISRVHRPLKQAPVKSNSISIIRLDDNISNLSNLIAITSKSISGIPLFFSRSLDGSYLSLEHTHPPASYVIHGSRAASQRQLKNIWFSKLYQNPTT